jgi:hypothetical protein
MDLQLCPLQAGKDETVAIAILLHTFYVPVDLSQCLAPLSEKQWTGEFEMLMKF